MPGLPTPPFAHAQRPVLVHAAQRVSVASMLYSQHYFTHIYPLKITVGLSWGDDSVIGVDNGDDVHPKQLMQCAIEIPALLLIVEIQVGHQNLKRLNRTCSREENDNFLGTALNFWNKSRLWILIQFLVLFSYFNEIILGGAYCRSTLGSGISSQASSH